MVDLNFLFLEVLAKNVLDSAVSCLVFAIVSGPSCSAEISVDG